MPPSMPPDKCSSMPQGLVQQSRPANWTSLPPIVVTKLPYFATYPIASPSGRAVWEVQANEAINTTDYVDIVVCRFPEPLKLQVRSLFILDVETRTCVCMHAAVQHGLCLAEPAFLVLPRGCSLPAATACSRRECLSVWLACVAQIPDGTVSAYRCAPYCQDMPPA